MRGLQKTVLEMLLRYMSHNPMEKLPKMFDLAEKLDRKKIRTNEIQALRDVLLNENSNWHRLTVNLFENVDLKLIQKFAVNFLIYANIEGLTRARANKEKYGVNIPWTILMDPTSACNLKCTGCWAAQYGGKHNLSYETLDSICRQGKELGIYFYIFSGGEPLVRKDDLIRLCEAHQDCYFFAFTNGTLVDEKFCQDLLRVGNFALAFSIEGDEEATDMRRGKGTYKKVIAAMELMRKHKLLFGYSTCYHRYNTESVASDEFVDDMIDRGCLFSWNFTYMPVGKDARPDLIATPEQRAHMYRRIREIRAEKPIFAMDFWNDGEFTQGCIAGGRNYIHINAAGDVEPCAFIHYANVNIHDVSLLEALQSPLFKEYQKNQPFNENHLRPCPLLDNPEKLAAIVKASGARSTDMEAPEDVDVLCGKTCEAAKNWAPVADKLWEERSQSDSGAVC